MCELHFRHSVNMNVQRKNYYPLIVMSVYFMMHPRVCLLGYENTVTTRSFPGGAYVSTVNGTMRKSIEVLGIWKALAETLTAFFLQSNFLNFKLLIEFTSFCLNS